MKRGDGVVSISIPDSGKEIEPVFENEQVSTTNVVSGFMKERVGGRQKSLSFLSFFSCRERPLLKGNNHPQLLNLPGMTTLAMLKFLYLSSLSKPAKKLKKLCQESYQNSNRENRHQTGRIIKETAPNMKRRYK